MSASRLPAPPRSAFPAPGPAGGRRRAPPLLLPFEGATEATPDGPLGSPAAAPASLPGEWQRIRRYAGGALLALCFALFGWQIWRGRAPGPVVLDAPPPVAARAGGELRVQVTGAVAAPGVYRLTAGDRVEDAVHAAGGFADGADTARVNLAQRVRDEQRLDIPLAGQPPAGADGAAGAAGGGAGPPPAAGLTPASLGNRPDGAAPSAPLPPGGVNVNTASAAELEALPGIGEVTARRILEIRAAQGRIGSLDELRRAGIPDALLRRAAARLVFD